MSFKKINHKQTLLRLRRFDATLPLRGYGMSRATGNFAATWNDVNEGCRALLEKIPRV